MDLKEFKKELKNLNKFASFEHEAAAEVVVHHAVPANDELDIDQYAHAHSISKAEVWNLIKQGKLVGRQVRGKILIQTEGIRAEEFENIEKNSNYPAEISIASYGQSTPSMQTIRLPELKLSGDQPTELALLLDHLSLIKDENREILRMAQESISKISEMAEQVVLAKDDVIRERDQRLKEQSLRLDLQSDQIELLKHKLTGQESDILDLKRNVEDLETLTRTLSSET